MKSSEPKIIFLNQMAGPLFRELSEDLAAEWQPSLLFTGHPDTIASQPKNGLVVKRGPAYDRSTISTRLFSWLRYFLAAVVVSLKNPRDALLLIVSNPPFLGIIGLVLKLIRRQKYAVLVYDIYPNLLVTLGRLKWGIVSRAWSFFNAVVLRRADLVLTIGSDMAATLERDYSLSKTGSGIPVVVPNWADVARVAPIDKGDNWFAREHLLIPTFNVLYSGNMGNTHDIESIVEVAKDLREHHGIRFLFIGEGAKWGLVQRTIADYALENITLLPFQPESVLPYSMATADVGIVTYEPGTEGLMVPSKTYYYMATGAAVIAICNKDTEISEMVKRHRCGLRVPANEPKQLKEAILELASDSALLGEFKRNARSAAESFYSRANTKAVAEAIARQVFFEAQPCSEDSYRN